MIVEFLTPPVVVAAIATGLSTGFTSFAGSWLLFRSKVKEAESARAAKEAEVEADLRKHVDQRLDEKWEAYTDRLEKRMARDREEMVRLQREAEDKFSKLQERVRHLERENDELKRWAAAIRRDLWHVHRYLHAMRMAMTQGNNDAAEDYARRALAKLDHMLDESEGLVEDSTPTIDEVPVP